MRLQDGRVVVMYNKQPLFDKGKIILNLVDNDFKPILGEDNIPKTLIKMKSYFSDNQDSIKLIGFVD